jgi:hypothetical protein
MKGRWTAFALTLGLTAVPALVSAVQDHAVPRGGGGGGGSSSAGEHHSGSSESSSGSSSGSSSTSSSSSSGDSRDSSPPQTDAQRRHPRPGTGTGDRFNGGGYYYGSPNYYGRNYYYDAFDPFYYGAYGYSPFYYSGSYGYAPYYYRGRYRDGGSLRVIVDPQQTRVYVDGYYAGIADDFDGIFQRLYVPPGRHEITLKLDGYRTHKFRVYVPVDQTLKIHHVMDRGTGEDTDEVIGEQGGYRREDERDRDDRNYGRDDRRYDGRRDRDENDQVEDERDDAEAATLRLDLKPSDASVYVDGELRGSGRRVETLRLAPGRHRLEVVRPGYRTVEREIEVRAGENTRVEIELGR